MKKTNMASVILLSVSLATVGCGRSSPVGLNDATHPETAQIETIGHTASPSASKLALTDEERQKIEEWRNTAFKELREKLQNRQSLSDEERAERWRQFRGWVAVVKGELARLREELNQPRLSWWKRWQLWREFWHRLRALKKKTQPISEELPLDNHTLALYHFDEGPQDASPNGFDLELTGNAHLTTENRDWMQHPGGQVLRVTGLGDVAGVAIPDALLMDGSYQAITLEARFYVRAYLAHGVAPFPNISLYQWWDTSLEVLDGKWYQPPVPKVKAGAFDIVAPSVWEANVATDTWHTLRITFDVDGTVECYVDDNLLGSRVVDLHPAPGPGVINITRTNDWLLTLGNFDGDIDEVRISTVVRSGPFVSNALADWN